MGSGSLFLPSTFEVLQASERRDRQRRVGVRMIEQLEDDGRGEGRGHGRSEAHTSELQSLMRSSYAVFCLKKRNRRTEKHTDEHQSLMRKSSDVLYLKKPHYINSV